MALSRNQFTDCPSAAEALLEKKQDAENILSMLKEQKVAQVTKIDLADRQEKAPPLYSLTALQRDANRFLGFTAQQTLDYTQSLYEKKLVTYPRTDSCKIWIYQKNGGSSETGNQQQQGQ